MSTIIDGSAGITFPNSTIQASAGQVLQVVTTTFITSASISSATYVSTGYSLSITPKFSTSKILVLMSSSLVSTTNANTRLTFYRNNSVDIAQNTEGLMMTSSVANGANQSFNIMFLDSPATTSSTSYNLYAKAPSGTSSLGASNSTSSIILMEIAA